VTCGTTGYQFADGQGQNYTENPGSSPPVQTNVAEAAGDSQPATVPSATIIPATAPATDPPAPETASNPPQTEQPVILAPYIVSTTPTSSGTSWGTSWNTTSQPDSQSDSQQDPQTVEGGVLAPYVVNGQSTSAINYGGPAVIPYTDGGPMAPTTIPPGNMQGVQFANNGGGRSAGNGGGAPKGSAPPKNNTTPSKPRQQKTATKPPGTTAKNSSGTGVKPGTATSITKKINNGLSGNSGNSKVRRVSPPPGILRSTDAGTSSNFVLILAIVAVFVVITKS
jgi:hypothetical protein